MYDNNHRETINGTEKEISCLKGELSNQMQINCFQIYVTKIQRASYKMQQRNPTKTYFAIDTPPQCLTIPLNSTTCDESDNVL